MAVSNLRKPTHKIVVAGTPKVVEKKIGTVANCYPGRLVEYVTGQAEIKVGTAAGKVIGWLGYEQAHGDYRPATVDTIYLDNAFVPVLYGGGFSVVASLASGDNVTIGALLVAAASGELTEADALAVPAGSTAVTSTSAAPAITGAYGSQGLVVARAMEDKDASSAAADIVVESLI